MNSTVLSACSDGMSCSLVQVESSYLKGFTGIQLIGNVTDVCRHGVERAKAALEAYGHPPPQRKVILNLAPADSKKDGSQFDLAFGVNLALLTTELKSQVDLQQWVFVAELGLDGRLREVKNIISFAIEAKRAGLEGIVTAKENAKDLLALSSISSSPLRELKICWFETIQETLLWLRCPSQFQRTKNPDPDTNQNKFSTDSIESTNFDDMVLTDEQKTLAKTVACGMHSLMLYGCPGTGKSMFSERIGSIFPELPGKIHLEVLKIHSSASSRLSSELLSGRPPYRAPHHQASAAAVIGIPETPGEASLAHGGILFLDEIPEFRRDILESLREPLETGEIRVSRAKGKMTWKSNMTLIAACNLCPCGWYASLKRTCSCPTSKIINYRKKLSGPILDRIDLHVNMKESGSASHTPFLFSFGDQQSSQTTQMKEQVTLATEVAVHRNAKFGVYYNKNLKPSDLGNASGLGAETLEKKLAELISVNASQRSVIRTIRVARSIADLRQADKINSEDIRLAWNWQSEASARQRGDHALGLL